MPTLTLAIPEDLKKDMETMPELNWSEIARKAIQEQAAAYKRFKAIVAKSKLEEKDARAIAASINESMYKKYKEQHDARKK
jgi:uncharacterized protein YktA (UPF0223 family)